MMMVCRSVRDSVLSPSSFGTYISVTLALTPTTASYATTIQAALTAALARNSVTPQGRQLSINPAFISVPVAQDGAPYTCKYIGDPRNAEVNVLRSSLRVSVCAGVGRLQFLHSTRARLHLLSIPRD